MRRERGFGVNPWRTHSRFLVSHNLLIDPAYADPMREWLGEMRPGSLLILDEAHHAAPSSGGRYGIETKFTRAVRDLGGRFEHRLFLSATPHNGHSNSFSTLLELLDPYRFTRGVKVRGKQVLDDVMVRRLKEDIREIQDGFPKRIVERIEIAGLPQDTPELILSQLLDEYRTVRKQRHKSTSAKAQAAAGLLVIGLQQRLLSSVEAFARSLEVHRKTVEGQWEQANESSGGDLRDPSLFTSAPDAEDERGEWSSEEQEAEEKRQIEASAALAEAETQRNAATQALWNREQALLNRMQKIAEKARGRPDAKMLRLIDWIRDNLCPALPSPGQASVGALAQWNDQDLQSLSRSLRERPANRQTPRPPRRHGPGRPRYLRLGRHHPHLRISARLRDRRRGVGQPQEALSLPLSRRGAGRGAGAAPRTQRPTRCRRDPRWCRGAKAEHQVQTTDPPSPHGRGADAPVGDELLEQIH